MDLGDLITTPQVALWNIHKTYLGGAADETGAAPDDDFAERV